MSVLRAAIGPSLAGVAGRVAESGWCRLGGPRLPPKWLRLAELAWLRLAELRVALIPRDATCRPDGPSTAPIEVPPLGQARGSSRTLGSDTRSHSPAKTGHLTGGASKCTLARTGAARYRADGNRWRMGAEWGIPRRCLTSSIDAGDVRGVVSGAHLAPHTQPWLFSPAAQPHGRLTVLITADHWCSPSAEQKEWMK